MAYKIAAYQVELSNGTKIQVEVDEVEKVLGAVNSGSAVMLKRGIIANPNFIVAIVPDYKRIESVEYDNHINAHDIRQGTKKPMELAPLRDEFAELRERASNQKMLK